MHGQKKIIVGIDPGSTFGIAVLGLDGKKLLLASTNDGVPGAAKIIEGCGTPSLVACDSKPAPQAAIRIASYFSCRLFMPKKEVREEEKRRMAFGAGTENAHERDAYCAAMMAYRAYSNKFRQIDAMHEIEPAKKDEIKHLLLRGMRMQDAIFLTKERQKESAPAFGGEEGKSAAQPPRDEKKLLEKVESLMRQNANLRLLVQRLEEEKAYLLRRIRLYENGARQAFLRDAEIRKLRFELKKAKLKNAKTPKQGSAESQGKGKSQSESQAKEASNSAGSSANAQSERIKINSFSENKIDLERLVAEYRKYRK